MIITTEQLLERMAKYGNPFGKIARMVKANELFPLRKGLYEDDAEASGYLMAGAIYGPSYISFNTALAYHGIIPEEVFAFNNATCGKLKKKEFRNHFGTFTYRDIPIEAFSYGVEIVGSGGAFFRIASAEKALCDKLYELPPVKSQKELEKMLFEDLRIDEDCFASLKRDDIYFLTPKYRSTNLYLLDKYLRRKNHE